MWATGTAAEAGVWRWCHRIRRLFGSCVCIHVCRGYQCMRVEAGRLRSVPYSQSTAAGTSNRRLQGTPRQDLLETFRMSVVPCMADLDLVCCFGVRPSPQVREVWSTESDDMLELWALPNRATAKTFSWRAQRGSRVSSLQGRVSEPQLGPQTSVPRHHNPREAHERMNSRVPFLRQVSTYPSTLGRHDSACH